MSKGRTVVSRVCAVFMTAALLVSMLSVVSVLPAAAENAKATSVNTFAADFSNLTAGEVSMDESDAVNAYLTSKFKFYYGEESWLFSRPNVNDYWEKANGDGTYSQITEIGSVQANDTIYTPDTHTPYSGGWAHCVAGIGASDAASGISKWAVSNDGMLYCDANFANETTFYHRFNQMTVLDANGEPAVLKNFEMTMDVKLRNENKDHFMISFRAATEATTRNFSDRAILAMQQQMWMLGGKDDAYRGGNASQFANFANNDAYADIDMPYDGAWSKLDMNKVYTVKLKAVNDKLTVELYDGDTKLYSQEKQTSWTNAGYITIGGSNAGAYYGNIEITRLDDNGNAIDFTPYEPEKFTVDFSGLAAGAVSTDANNAVTKYLKEKFHFYYEQEGTLFGRPNVNDYYVDKDGNPITGKLDSDITVYAPDTGADMGNSKWKDGIGTSAYTNGIATWTISNDGFLSCDATYISGEYFRRYNQMTVLDANGDAAKLRNFEMTMTFKLRNVYRDHLTVAFRASTEATAVTKDGSNEDRALLSLNASGYFLGGPTDDADAYNNHFAQDQWPDVTYSDLGTTETYTLKLRVVGKNVSATIYKADGSQLTTYAKETNWTQEGYIVIGGSNAGGYYGNIEITRLDDEGKAVDFTPAPDEIETFKASFSDLAAGEVSLDSKDAVNAYLTEKFKFYYAEEGWMFSRPNANDYWQKANGDGTYSPITELGSVAAADTVYTPDTHTPYSGGWAHCIAGIGASDAASGISKWMVSEDGMLYCDANFASEPGYFHRFNQMTVLDANGEAAVLKNFELTMDVKLRKESRDHFMISFRAKTEATQRNFTDRAIFAMQEQMWMLGGKDDAYRNNDPNQFANFANSDAYADIDMPYDGAWSKLDLNKVYTVKLKALNDKLYVELYDGGTLLYAQEKLTSWTGDGYITIGGSNAGAYYNNIEITRLNDKGEPVDFTGYVDNVVTVKDDIVTVIPAPGYELKAGSLLATDVNGNVYVPQRVGFREGGNASQYKVLGGTAPYTVTYEFVQPTQEQPNIGNIGISCNIEKVGLRFISRFTRKVVNGVECVVFDDQAYTIKDYGMLLTTDMGLQTTANTSFADEVEKTLVINSVNRYVQKLSAVQANKYYDLCDDHVDMAVTVINIDKVQGYGDPDLIQIYARPYVVVEVNGVDTPLYGEYINSNNKDVAKAEEKITSTVAELNTQNVVLLNGRHTLNADGSMSTWLGNTGFTMSGVLAGDVDVTLTYTPPEGAINQSAVCRLNIMVDGVYREDVILRSGDTRVRLADDLVNGEHTITISKAMGTPSFGELKFKKVTYYGDLKKPAESDLQFMFIGDSITDSVGVYQYAGDPNSIGWVAAQAPSENVRLGYAALTSKALDASFSMVSQSGQTTAQAITLLNETKYGAEINNDKDVVVINLGTNDTWRIGHASHPNVTRETVATDVKNCLTAVREKYPNATIVWVYGMMSITAEDVISGAVADWVAQTGDSNTSYYSLSAAQNQVGGGDHPDEVGHQNAAKLLTAYLSGIVSVDRKAAKTYATNRQLKVALVGDSITAGGYWQNNLQGELSTDKYAVNGFGVSGSTALVKGVDWASATSNVGKAYVNQTAYADSLAYKADAVVIMLGTNDSKDVNWNTYGDEFIYDYISLVKAYQNSSSAPQVFIALPPTVYNPDGNFQNINNTVIERDIIPALEKVAAITGAVLVDTHTPTADAQALTTDGVHPNDAGKAILCKTIAAAISARTEAVTTKVYLSSVAGNDANNGSIDAPVATLDKALAVVSDGGTVVVADTYIPAYNTLTSNYSDKTVTITGGTFDASALSDVHLRCGIVFDNIAVKFKDGSALYANGKPLTINENVTVEGTIAKVFGGSYRAEVSSTYLKLMSGNYKQIFGGCWQNNVTGTAKVYVGGNVNASLDVTTENNSDVGIYGGGFANNTYNYSCEVGATDITIADNAKMYFVYGGGEKYATAGETKVTMTGGAVAQVFGGNKNNSLTGNTYVYLLGGKVYRCVYGGCDNTGSYFLPTTGQFYVTGSTNVYVGKAFTFVHDFDTILAEDFAPSVSGVSVSPIFTAGTYAAEEGIRAGSRVTHVEGEATGLWAALLGSEIKDSIAQTFPYSYNNEAENATLYFEDEETKTAFVSLCGPNGDSTTHKYLNSFVLKASTNSVTVDIDSTFTFQDTTDAMKVDAAQF